MIWLELKPILWNLLKLIIIIPIFAYGILYSLESLIKAWKSGSKLKKWFALSLTLLFLSIALGGLQ